MNGSDPAFPAGFTPISTSNEQRQLNGLTKREYFAALAMQGMYAHGNWIKEEIPPYAVRAADALIAELSKEKP